MKGVSERCIARLLLTIGNNRNSGCINDQNNAAYCLPINRNCALCHWIKIFACVYFCTTLPATQSDLCIDLFSALGTSYYDL